MEIHLEKSSEMLGLLDDKDDLTTATPPMDGSVTMDKPMDSSVTMDRQVDVTTINTTQVAIANPQSQPVQVSTINWAEVHALLSSQNVSISAINNPNKTLMGTCDPMMADVNPNLPPMLDITAMMANNLAATKADVVTPLPLPQNLHATPTDTHNGLPQIPVSVSNTDTEPRSVNSKSDTQVSTSTSNSLTNTSADTPSNEVLDNDDDEELCDGMIETPMETTPSPPMISSPVNTRLEINSQASINSTNGDLIQLQQPGVQLTVFHYNMLPVVGNVYKVNSQYHLEKVKYPQGNWYLSNSQGTLERANFPPDKLYQSNAQGTLQEVQYIPHQVYQANNTGTLLRPLDVITGSAKNN
jgi:hypothetical protein